MNNRKIYISIIIAALSVSLLAGCRDNEVVDSVDAPDSEAVYLKVLGAVFAGSPEDDEVIEVEDPSSHTDNFETTDLLNDAFHDGDYLFFSQLVSGKLEPFKSKPVEQFPTNMPESMRNKYATGYPNIYRYSYNQRYESTWDDDPGGYNFFPNDTTTQMKWDDIKFWGLNNTGYVLYGLYYPYNNTLPIDEETGNIDFMVEKNQTTKDALRKSNFIGAYHSSSKSGQRLKFKLYHLGAYIKVTLYVPVFNPHDTIIDTQGKKVEVRTGFPADALQSAEVRNVYNHYRINWYGGRSSDTAPITMVNTEYPRTDVSMYIPGAEDYTESDGLPPIVNVRLADYIRDAASDKSLPETDQCWKITLSALIPGGQDYPIDDPLYPKGQTWTDLNFLRFNFRQNIGEVPKRYVFSGNSLYGLIGSGDLLNISQGRIQHLSLYIPRYGEQAVLLGANVEDWEQWYNDNMGLRKEDPVEPEDPVDPDNPEDPDDPDNPTDPGDNSGGDDAGENS